MIVFKCKNCGKTFVCSEIYEDGEDGHCPSCGDFDYDEVEVENEDQIDIKNY